MELISPIYTDQIFWRKKVHHAAVKSVSRIFFVVVVERGGGGGGGGGDNGDGDLDRKKCCNCSCRAKMVLVGKYKLMARSFATKRAG